MIPGVDSYGTLDGAELVAAGKRFAGRYISGNNPLGMAEAQDLTTHGIGIVSLYETSPTAALGRESAGLTDAISALRGTRLGTRNRQLPLGSCIVFAADFDCRAWETQVSDYWRRARSFLLGTGLLAGGYGPQDVVESCLQRGTIDVGVVAGAWRSGVPIGTQVALVQEDLQVMVGGVECDVLVARRPHFGAWNLAGLWPPAPTEETDMVIVKNTVNGGLELVHGDRRAGIPNPTAEAALRAQGITERVMTAEALAELTAVPWGSI